MNGYLLDTNVVSEIVRSAPDSQVLSFLAEQEVLWLSAIVLHELEYGLNLLSPGRRREDLRNALSAYIETNADFVLPVGRAEAEEAALLRARARRAGHVLHLADALVAGTAKVCNLILATRNVKDFAALDVEVFNPWESL
ncbi:MAG: type II toxin-antitoxin system VapC family toxin [Caldilineaceae bacterium SB0661_bin_32]|uniref:Ribonuclease VapC n=1 Tax=Caldilineaceae bacterium SB0661_bin_32 TaxID=2605255 RepID=A0A6B1D6Z1_9CHLR|nr:type II toxin-antitoxin system VapC family toxin [Caldilineaceae bacterium SB0661_bin_32]